MLERLSHARIVCGCRVTLQFVLIGSLAGRSYSGMPLDAGLSRSGVR